MGTQGALAGVGDAVGAAHRVVDHGAGHQLPAILQRGPAVLAAVQLGKTRTAKALPRLCSVRGSPNISPLLTPLPDPKRICQMTNGGYILTRSSWKTSNFLSQPSLEKTESRLEGRHYSLSSAFITMPLYLTEPTRILQKAAEK